MLQLFFIGKIIDYIGIMKIRNHEESKAKLDEKRGRVHDTDC
ncbi:hypothetical protein HMPREF9413_1953 [Paenibacillus sp. HGF7]|nr:hypothetical protein HMPREF9413_1953 [Paenibacillus sp. HGF7]